MNTLNKLKKGERAIFKRDIRRRRTKMNDFFYVYVSSFLITINLLFYLMAEVYAHGDFSLPFAVTIISIFPVCYSLIQLFPKKEEYYIE